MGMDRRMLLAMLLAILVIFFNSLIFGPKDKAVQPAPETAREVPTTSAEAPELRAPHVAAPATTAEAIHVLTDPSATMKTGDLVRVETRLVIAELDPLGGTLRSWKLLKYTDAAGNVAE